MQKLTIATRPEYSVVIGHDLLRNAAYHLADCWGSECFIASDSTVAKLYLPQLQSALTAAGKRTGEVIFPAGEANKTLSTVEKLLDAFARFGLTRSGTVLALGGGVTGDIAGFASAIWLRGVPVIQLPTTLLAMVDSSVGGKTGIDLACGKNLVGAFHQPRKVLADLDTLQTLPEEQRLEGLAEMLKAGIIRDPDLFAQLQSEPQSALSEEAIARSVSLKGAIVAADEFERGERKLLNLGHTAAHALEKISNYRLSHGRAVALGLSLVAEAGWRQGITSASCRQAIAEALTRCNLPRHSPYSMEELLPAMGLDKKRAGDKITLVVPREIGDCTLLQLAIEEMPAFWGATRELKV